MCGSRYLAPNCLRRDAGIILKLRLQSLPRWATRCEEPNKQIAQLVRRQFARRCRQEAVERLKRALQGEAQRGAIVLYPSARSVLFPLAAGGLL